MRINLRHYFSVEVRLETPIMMTYTLNTTLWLSILSNNFFPHPVSLIHALKLGKHGKMFLGFWDKSVASELIAALVSTTKFVFFSHSSSTILILLHLFSFAVDRFFHFSLIFQMLHVSHSSRLYILFAKPPRFFPSCFQQAYLYWLNSLPPMMFDNGK